MIFQRFNQNKYKRKRENRCHVTLKPLKGGRANGFGSSRSLNNRFCGLGRKNRFGPKLREAEMTFSLKMCVLTIFYKINRCPPSLLSDFFFFHLSCVSTQGVESHLIISLKNVSIFISNMISMFKR